MKTWMAVIFALLLELSPELLYARGPSIGPTVAVRRATSPATASIEGIVLDSATNQPIVGAQVAVSPTNYSDGAPSSVVTDSQGHFIVKALDGGDYGTYRIRFQASGYVSQALGQTTFPGQGTTVTVAVGQALKDVVMRMVPTGAVSGRIHDATGRPISGVQVFLVQPRYDSRGQKTFQRAGTGRSNDRGEYRIYWTSPGRYAIVAGGVPSGPGSLSGGTDLANNFPNELPEATVPVFYPNSPDFSGATTIEVRPGAEASSIDFALKPLVLHRVRGKLIAASGTQAPARANVQVNSLSLLGATNRFNGFYDPATGSVEARDLPPGAYQIVVTPQETGPVIGPLARSAAQVDVTIRDADVNDIVWAVRSPSTVSGRYVVDGGAPPAGLQLRFALRPSIPGVVPQAQAPDASGAFRVENILPGEYNVDSFAPAPYYLKEVRLGGADILGRPFRFEGADPGAFEVILSTKGAQLEGTILNDKQQPMPTTQMMLIPERLRDRVDLYKMARTDANGRFSLSNLAPGDYRVFAWEAIDQYAWFDPSVLRQFEQRGRLVHLNESGKETVEVRMIPAGAQ